MAQSQSIRLLTFNIAHGRGLSPYQGLRSFAQLQQNLIRIARFLDRQHIDIAALQEVDEDSHWNRRINMLETLRDQTALNHAVMGLTNQRPGPRPLNYGNGLLSRYPVRNWNSQRFHACSLGGKGFLFAEVETGALSLGVVNLHLDFRSRKRRILQVDQLIEFLEQVSNEQAGPGIPPLICGDFNAGVRRSSDALRKLFDYLTQNANYQLLPVNQRTFPSPLPSRGIDFVLLPPTCHVIRCDVASVYLSDHRPVLVEFRVPVTSAANPPDPRACAAPNGP